MPKLKKIIFHPGVFIPLLLVIFLGTAALAKLFLWPSIQKYQANQYKHEASSFLEKGNFRNAFIEIRKAILKDPDDLEIYKLALRTVENSPDHYQYIPGFLQQLMEMEPHNQEHFFKFILLTLRIEKLEEAQAAFQKYPEEAKQSEDYHQIGYSLGMGTNNFEMADYHLEKLIELRPDDAQLIYSLSTLRLKNSEDEEQIFEAKQALSALTEIEDSRAPALRVLLTHSLIEKNREKISEHIAELKQIPNLGIRDRLLILQAEKFILPDSFESRVVELLEGDIQEPNDVNLTLDFLLKNKLFDSATFWIETLGKDLKENEGVSRKISQIYYQTEDWEKLKESILDVNWGEYEFGRFLLLAQVSKIQSDPLAFRKYWQQCLIQVGSNLEYLKLLFETTVKWEWKNESIEVLERSFHEDPTDRELFGALLNHFMSIGDTTRALEALSRRIEYVSDDLGSKNNFALLSLISGINQSKAFAFARDNYSADSENPYFKTTWAYALHKQDRLKEASELIDSLSTEDRNNPQRALYIAQMYLTLGKRDLAKQFLNRVSEASLFPEEKNLLKFVQKSLEKSEE